MVKVELSYNPYLMETKVMFDGRKPRINSRVEKYYNAKLQDWINEIPQIFYEEMNGYGFEVEFSGTKMDFEQLKKTFTDAGILEDQVLLFQKNEIESREKKVDELDQLLDWLATEKNNGLFDTKEFLAEHGEKLNEEYTFITVNGRNANTRYYREFNISVEDVDSIEELSEVNLKNIPIIIFVTRGLLSSLQSTILGLKQRKDVIDHQLYFIISETLNAERIERIIRDLGIQNIQIVQSAYEQSIKDFYYAYPVTDHLHTVLDVLKGVSNTINNLVEERRKECEFSNQEIHEQISGIDETLERLKAAHEKLQTRGNVELPEDCIAAQNKLRENILGWKKNKVKFSSENAEKNVFAFNEQLRLYYVDFIKTVVEAVSSTINQSLQYYKDIYCEAQYDDFEVTWADEDDNNNELYTPPLIVKSLMELKKEEFVSPKADLKDFIFGDDSPKEPELVTTYYCQEWRNYAISVFSPLSDDVIKKQFEKLKNALDVAAKNYIVHIEEAIEKELTKKKTIASQFSHEELELQQDSEWSTTFLERIKRLERV